MNLEIADRWLSVQEIAHYLGISKETVYRWLDSKKSLPIKSGNSGNLKRMKLIAG